jgi:HAD superfamily hydrolase (TIGR01450 family)
MSPVPRFAGYLFDLDGTVYLGDEALPGAVAAIGQLRAEARRIVFVSNNPTHTPAEYVARLARIGIAVPEAAVLNSAQVLIEWLGHQQPGARIYAIGEAPLQHGLDAAGFVRATDPRATDVVVASFDRDFSYRKLQFAFDALRAGARLVATNGDRYCPVPGGGEPDAAAVIAAISACTGIACEQIVGKPSAIMARAALARIGLAPAACLMVGDRLETDIAMGRDAGMATALTLTGATSRAEALRAPDAPDFCIDTLADLVR